MCRQWLKYIFSISLHITTIVPTYVTLYKVQPKIYTHVSRHVMFRVLVLVDLTRNP